MARPGLNIAELECQNSLGHETIQRFIKLDCRAGGASYRPLNRHVKRINKHILRFCALRAETPADLAACA